MTVEDPGIVPNSSLVAHNLVRYYGKLRVVNDVTIEVGQGEVVGLLGPNGGRLPGYAQPHAGRDLASIHA